MATTTLPSIQDQIVTNIKAIVPNQHTDKTFQNYRRRKPFRDYVLEHNGSHVFRQFTVERTGVDVQAEFTEPNSIERRTELTITVAYAALPGLYRQGVVPDDTLDIDEIIRRDARDIHDVVFSPDNYVSGQNAAFVTIDAPDRADDRVTFQTFTVEVIFYEAMSL